MTISSTSPTDALALAEQLRPALRRLYRQLRSDTGGDTISPLHSQLLVVIDEHPGIGVGELAQLEKLRSPTMSGHIKSMVTAGWVKRLDAASGDGRRVGLAITTSGRALIHAKRKQRTDRLAQALARLSPESLDAIRSAIPALNELDA